MLPTDSRNTTTSLEVLHSQGLISIEAEQAVIGALLLDNNKILEVTDKIDGDDFCDERLKTVFLIMQNLHKEKIPFNLITIGQHLKTEMDDKNIIPYLAELIQNTPSANNIKYYAAIVTEKSNARQTLGLIKLAEMKLMQGQKTSAIISEINIKLAKLKNRMIQKIN